MNQSASGCDKAQGQNARSADDFGLIEEACRSGMSRRGKDWRGKGLRGKGLRGKKGWDRPKRACRAQGLTPDTCPFLHACSLSFACREESLWGGA
jgi:hypothetical protein